MTMQKNLLGIQGCTCTPLHLTEGAHESNFVDAFHAVEATCVCVCVCVWCGVVCTENVREPRRLQAVLDSGDGWHVCVGTWRTDPVQQRRRRSRAAVRRDPDRTADRHCVTAATRHASHSDTNHFRRRRHSPTQGD